MDTGASFTSRARDGPFELLQERIAALQGVAIARGRGVQALRVGLELLRARRPSAARAAAASARAAAEAAQLAEEVRQRLRVRRRAHLLRLADVRVLDGDLEVAPLDPARA